MGTNPFFPRRFRSDPLFILSCDHFPDPPFVTRSSLSYPKNTTPQSINVPIAHLHTGMIVYIRVRVRKYNNVPSEFTCKRIQMGHWKVDVTKNAPKSMYPLF